MCRGEAALLSSCFADNELELSRFKAAEVMIDFLVFIFPWRSLTQCMSIFIGQSLKAYILHQRVGCSGSSSPCSKDKMFMSAHIWLIASSQVHNKMAKTRVGMIATTVTIYSDQNLPTSEHLLWS